MKARILICMGTSGISAGAKEVAKRFEEEIKNNNIEDRFEIIGVGDRGLFRDVLVDVIEPGKKRIVYEYVKPIDVKKIVKNHLLEGNPIKELLAGNDYEKFFSNQMRIILSNCGEINPEDIDEYIKNGGYEAAKKAFKTSPNSIIDQVKKSGLRGRGGAGFPTGLKWELCRKAKGDTKYIICNADEGDPGAFMDRSILEGDPHSVIEGMIIGAYAIGANVGYIYCRAEYPLAVKRLNIALEQARKKKFLGDNIFGSNFSFDLVVKEGAGAFVCGEETALMASIEGKRGMPNPRPPYPTEFGLWGKPTCINNVETFANISHIILKGANWFSSIGYKNSKGTKVFALAGKVRNTGLVEVPMGTTIREIIWGPGGGMENKRIPFKAVQLGGPSGGCLSEDLIDIPVDYESINRTGAIMGSGGMVVMDDRTCMVDIARFFLNFTVAESCGKCVPCRIGLKRMLEILELITEGKGHYEHLEFLKEMGEIINETALCGLGNTAPNPVMTTIRYFKDEYEAHIEHKYCPSHVCTQLIEFEINRNRCIRCGHCSMVCPVKAIVWEKKKYPKIDKDKCIKCKTCVSSCPTMAII
jgi:NADH-quinone oxidoreductase subunit F